MTRIIETHQVTPESTEEFVFTPLRDGARVEIASAVLRRRNVKTGAEDEFSTEDPAPLLAIEGENNYRLRFSPDETVWPAAHSTYRADLLVTLAGGGVLKYPQFGCLEFRVVEPY